MHVFPPNKLLCLLGLEVNKKIPATVIIFTHCVFEEKVQE